MNVEQRLRGRDESPLFVARVDVWAAIGLRRRGWDQQPRAPSPQRLRVTSEDPASALVCAAEVEDVELPFVVRAAPSVPVVRVAEPEVFRPNSASAQLLDTAALDVDHRRGS